MLDDALLVAGCLKGEPTAWRDFLDQYGGWIYAVISRQLDRYGFSTRPDIKDDVYQEVFCYLVEKNALARLENLKALRAYLAVIAASRAIDAIRALVRVEGSEIELLEDDALDNRALQLRYTDRLSDKTHFGELARMVHEEIELLPSGEKLTLQLRWYHGMKAREIAETTGIPENTVASVIHRGREKLRVRLAQKGIGVDDLG